MGKLDRHEHERLARLMDTRAKRGLETRPGLVRNDDADRWLRDHDPDYFGPKVTDERRRPVRATADLLASFVDVDVATAHRDAKVIYFVQAESGGPVKIGSSHIRGLQTRFDALQSGHPERLVLRRLVAGNIRIERALHRYFAELRVRPDGEWFNVDDELARLAHIPAALDAAA